MASDLEFVEYAWHPLGDMDRITFRETSGDHAVFCKGKVVAPIRDNPLFAKPKRPGAATRPGAVRT